MSDHVLRIFSYLPNPRVWKALIAADYLGVTVQVLGDKPKTSVIGYGILMPENSLKRKNRRQPACTS